MVAIYSVERANKIEYPFLKVSDAKRIEKIDLKLGDDYNDKFVKDKLALTLVDDVYQSHYEHIKELIFNMWLEKLGVDNIQDIKHYKWFQPLKNYIVYKTIKISKNYNQYGDFYNQLIKYLKNMVLSGRLDFKFFINSHIDNLISTPSHITFKLMRSLAFLKYRHLSNLVNLKEEEFLYDLKTLNKDIDAAKYKNEKIASSQGKYDGLDLFTGKMKVEIISDVDHEIKKIYVIK